MILTRKRLPVDVFLTRRLSKSLAVCEFASVNFEPWLAEHRTGNREVTGSNPVEVLNFFSGFFPQLHKLRSRRRSFLHFQK